jgi:hypothetical protein
MGHGLFASAVCPLSGPRLIHPVKPNPPNSAIATTFRTMILFVSDPNGPDWVPNEHGSLNSVLAVQP